MTRNISDTKLLESIIFKSKILALYEIIGGFVGISLTIYIIFKLNAFPFLLVCMFFIAFGLYIYSIICGIIILKNLRIGFKLSRINQFLQILNFSVLGYGFNYISGLFIRIGMDLSEPFNFILEWGASTWKLDFNNSQSMNYFSINIIAVILLLFIDKHIKELDTLDFTQKLSEIGDQ